MHACLDFGPTLPNVKKPLARSPTNKRGPFVLRTHHQQPTICDGKGTQGVSSARRLGERGCSKPGTSSVHPPPVVQMHGRLVFTSTYSIISCLYWFILYEKQRPRGVHTLVPNQLLSDTWPPDKFDDCTHEKALVLRRELTPRPPGHRQRVTPDCYTLGS